MESGTDLLKVWSCRVVAKILLPYFSKFNVKFTICYYVFPNPKYDRYSVSGKIRAYSLVTMAWPDMCRSINDCHDVDGCPERCSGPLRSLLLTASTILSLFPSFFLQIFATNTLI